jgi:hypothetical protein
MIVLDTSAHFKHGKVIKCDFKPGSVERSIDLYQRGYIFSRQYVQLPPSIKIEKFSNGYKNPQAIFQILTVLIDILEA